MTVLEEQTDKGYMLRIYVDIGRGKDGLMATYVYNKDSQEIEEKVYKRGWVEDYRRCFNDALCGALCEALTRVNNNE